jgi:tetratricopeptide (TPR) repeat protein
LNEEAEEHYRRAFELMPDSFGRVESHCFGCEGSFGGEKAQNIAERVFTGLLAKSPEKPQLHYLLGFLRNQQERYPEAVTHLRQAVKLDPDYLNAWKLLKSLSENVNMSAQEEDDAAVNLLRLDPADKHGGGHAGVNDLGRLWNAIKEVAARIPEKPAKLFRLPASAEQLEKRKQDLANARYGGRLDSYDYGGERTSKNPADAVAADPIIQAASHAAFGSSSMRGFE